MSYAFDLSSNQISVDRILRNVAPAKLYEEALKHEKNTLISNRGAPCCLIGGENWSESER